VQSPLASLATILPVVQHVHTAKHLFSPPTTHPPTNTATRHNSAARLHTWAAAGWVESLLLRAVLHAASKVCRLGCCDCVSPRCAARGASSAHPHAMPTGGCGECMGMQPALLADVLAGRVFSKPACTIGCARSCAFFLPGQACAADAPRRACVGAFHLRVARCCSGCSSAAELRSWGRAEGDPLINCVHSLMGGVGPAVLLCDCLRRRAAAVQPACLGGATGPRGSVVPHRHGHPFNARRVHDAPRVALIAR